MSVSKLVVNVFCRTGQGGGVDPKCGKSGSAASKLGVSGRAVLAEAARSSLGLVSLTSAYGRKRTGGRVSSPETRKKNAADKLMKAGLLEKIGNVTERDTGRGMTTSFSTITYRITMQGRQALTATPDVIAKLD